MATPLNIKDPEAYRLASEIARVTGQSLTRVVIDALKQRQASLAPAETIDMRKVNRVLSRLQAVPSVDPRSGKEIMDSLYDNEGLSG